MYKMKAFGSKTSNENISIVSMNTIEMDIHWQEDDWGHAEQIIDPHCGTFTVTATITAKEAAKASTCEDVAEYIINTYSELLGDTVADTDSTYGCSEWDKGTNEMVMEDIVDYDAAYTITKHEDGSATVVWTANVAQRTCDWRMEVDLSDDY